MYVHYKHTVYRATPTGESIKLGLPFNGRAACIRRRKMSSARYRRYRRRWYRHTILTREK